ncbi:MAG: response regulator transcription factor [Chitinophagaceae bacterium]|nr:response regulator transcription factor [Chitinophagaceae bacterium]
MISILIVEDTADYLKSLQDLFNKSAGFICKASYSNAEDCMKDNAYLHVDIAIVDIQLPGMNGIQLVKWLTERNTDILCMMCTAYEENEKVFLALEAGAHGYILKSASTAEILEAVIDLKNGGSPMSNQVARKVVQSFRKISAPAAYQLTPRESEVLQLLSKGLLYKEIAQQLHVSSETVRRHCFNIYDKLHVHNRTEALNKYFGKP